MYVIVLLFLLHESKALSPAPGDNLGVSHSPDDIHFYLYSSSRNPKFRQEIIYNDKISLESSAFLIQAQKTVIMIHGFTDNAESHFPSLIKNAYLKSSFNYNYIVMDWGPLATSNNTLANMIMAAPYADIVLKSIPIVARRVSDFLRFLYQNSYASLDSIHIVGHSLGAHVGGNAGNLINQDNNGTKKIGRISGLDPAGPLFDGIQVQRKLQPGDGDFVDVYHAAMVARGSTSLDGHVDFYPNGGVTQPPCNILDTVKAGFPLTIGSCSHQFIVNIFAATISKNFTACQCNPIVLDFNYCPTECADSILAGQSCPTSQICCLNRFKSLCVQLIQCEGSIPFQNNEYPLEDKFLESVEKYDTTLAKTLTKGIMNN